MNAPRIDMPTSYATCPRLAAVALFALFVDAHATGEEKARRALAYRLKRLGWRVEPVEPLGEEVGQ